MRQRQEQAEQRGGAIRGLAGPALLLIRRQEAGRAPQGRVTSGRSVFALTMAPGSCRAGPERLLAWFHVRPAPLAQCWAASNPN